MNGGEAVTQAEAEKETLLNTTEVFERIEPEPAKPEIHTQDKPSTLKEPKSTNTQNFKPDTSTPKKVSRLES